MTAERRKLSLAVAAIAAPLVAAILAWAMHAFADQAVAPVRDRVRVLETQRQSDADLLKEVRGDVKEILRRMPRE